MQASSKACKSEASNKAYKQARQASKQGMQKQKAGKGAKCKRRESQAKAGVQAPQWSRHYATLLGARTGKQANRQGKQGHEASKGMRRASGEKAKAKVGVWIP